MVFVARAGDSHHPFQHKPSVKAWLDWIKKYKPEVVILGGDDSDMYHCSRYIKSDKSFQTGDEVRSCKRYVRKVREAAPSADIYYIEGNHEERLSKYLLRGAPGVYGVEGVQIPHFLGLEDLGITWVPSDKDLRIDGVLHRHGDRVSTLPGRTALMHLTDWGENVAVGHCHRLGIVYHRLGKKILFGVECGSLCSDKAANGYKHNPNWCRGWVSIIDGEPEVYRV